MEGSNPHLPNQQAAPRENAQERACHGKGVWDRDT